MTPLSAVTYMLYAQVLPILKEYMHLDTCLDLIGLDGLTLSMAAIALRSVAGLCLDMTLCV
jgi:hypothetical protein